MTPIASTAGAYASVKRVQADLGISRATVYRWAALGLLPTPVKLGPSRIGFPLQELQDALANRPRVLLKTVIPAKGSPDAKV